MSNQEFIQSISLNGAQRATETGLPAINNPEANFNRLMAFKTRMRASDIHEQASAEQIDRLTQELRQNLLFFHAIRGGLPGLRAILQDGFVDMKEVRAKMGSATTSGVDNLMGTDRAAYFAIGTPNMYIAEHGFSGPILVYDWNGIGGNDGYINMSNVYSGSLRSKFDPWLKGECKLTKKEDRKMKQELRSFINSYLGRMLPFDLRYVARYMAHQEIESLLDLFTQSRSWEAILINPTARPRAIIFRSREELAIAQAAFPELLEGITLLLQESHINTEGMSLQALDHIMDGSTSLVNLSEVYGALGLSIGELRPGSPIPRDVIAAMRNEGINEDLIQKQIQRKIEDNRIYS